MTTRIGISALAFLLLTAFAANATGDNVVIITVGHVALPAKLPGLCDLSGAVSQVLEGKRFRAGQVISLKVPCSGGESHLIPAVAVLGAPDNVRFIAADVLEKSQHGLARIDDAGALIWQYSKSAYGRWGVAGGYRVLDVGAVPAAPAAPRL
ncbi:MAG TPA: hypothetical protein VNW15_04010 [Rhizomicrobium sp.]|jgi:hypothetical protein|nr:hypothetical protein [Rhizomicrobium sp.]